MRYIFFTFSFIFFSFKKVFSSKKYFCYKTFFPRKNIFSAINVYFVKNTNIFSKKNNFFFNLVLQQMNNHIPLPLLCVSLELIHIFSQLTFTCSNSTTDTLKKKVWKGVFLLLTLKAFHTFFYCFYCWLWTSKFTIKIQLTENFNINDNPTFRWRCIAI